MIDDNDHYSIYNLASQDANYYAIIGQRKNGKSYSVKSYGIRDAYLNGRKFVYVRRWYDNIKTTAKVRHYFGDAPVSLLTDGEYDSLVFREDEIYLAKKNGSKYVRGVAVGFYCCLAKSEDVKGWSFDDCYNVIYEEFITNKIYLDNEPNELLHLIATIVRDRKGAKVFLIGNTLSRLCPYFREWDLDKSLEQPINTIMTYKHHWTNKETGKKSTTIILVERTPDRDDDTNMFFGSSAEQIIGGSWESYEQPKLKGHYIDYDCLYELIVEHDTLSYVVQLLYHRKGGYNVVYVYPNSKGRETDIGRLVTNSWDTDGLHITPNIGINDAELLILDAIRGRKIRFCDNRTGTDFINILRADGLVVASWL